MTCLGRNHGGNLRNLDRTQSGVWTIYSKSINNSASTQTWRKIIKSVEVIYEGDYLNIIHVSKMKCWSSELVWYKFINIS
jgi:hypothetical protein